MSVSLCVFVRRHLRIFTYEWRMRTAFPTCGIINPVLTLGKILPDPYEKGCHQFRFPLKRAQQPTAAGFARCMQHETDHLDGKRT